MQRLTRLTRSVCLPADGADRFDPTSPAHAIASGGGCQLSGSLAFDFPADQRGTGRQWPELRHAHGRAGLEC